MSVKPWMLCWSVGVCFLYFESVVRGAYSWLSSSCLRNLPCSTAFPFLISCLLVIYGLGLIPFSIPLSLLVREIVFPSFTLQGKNSKESVYHLHSVLSWVEKWLIWVGNDLNRFLGCFRWLVKRRSCLLYWKGKTNLSESFSRVEQGEILFPSLRILKIKLT